MNSSNYLAHRLNEVLLEGRWIANTNFREQIELTTRDEAVRKIGALNSVAALTYHINYYLEGILNVFHGGTLEIRDKYSFDMPPIDASADWQNLIDRFTANAHEFTTCVEKMSGDRLNSVFVDEKYGSFSRNIEGVIEHSYYHLGQVVLIRKLIAGRASE